MIIPKVNKKRKLIHIGIKLGIWSIDLGKYVLYLSLFLKVICYVHMVVTSYIFFCQIYKFNEKFWNSSKESENGNGNAELMEKLAKKNWPGPNKNRSNLRINIFIQPQEIYSKNVVYFLQNQNLRPVLVRQLFVYL